VCKEEIRQRRAQRAAQRDNEDEPMETDEAQTKTLYWTKDTFWTTGLKPRSECISGVKYTSVFIVLCQTNFMFNEMKLIYVYFVLREL